MKSIPFRRLLPLGAALAFLPSSAFSAPLQKLEADDASRFDLFGSAVAVDGSFAVAGAPDNNENGYGSGAAYVFDAQTGVQLHKLTPSDAGPKQEFGSAVAAFGGLALVGAPGDADGGRSSGAAYLFDLASGAQLLKLTASDAEAFDHLGSSVALSSEFALVGAPSDRIGHRLSGSVYVFRLSDGGQERKLVPAGHGHYSFFGWDLDVDGDTAVVGTPGRGAAFLYEISSGDLLHELNPPSRPFYRSNLRFGWSVAVSGPYALVGAPHDKENGGNSGAVYVFDVDSGDLTDKLLASDGAPADRFGTDVSASAPTALVGAPGNDDNGSGSGASYLFDLTTGSETEKLLPDDGDKHDEFGSTVGLGGGLAIVGAPYDEDPGGSRSGSAYLFGAGGGPTLTITGETVNEGDGSAEFSITLSEAAAYNISVNYATVNITAVAPGDYTETSGTLIIPAGDTTASIPVPIRDDLRVEATEEFEMVLSDGAGVSIPDPDASAFIEDNDETMLYVEDLEIQENDVLDARVLVRLTNPSDFVITCNYDQFNGSAKQGEDWGRRRFGLTFAPGQMEHKVFVPIANDEIAEPTEGFRFVISNPSGAAILDDESRITIYDDDNPGPVSPQTDFFGWQWPNSAQARPELDYTDYLMTEGTLVGAFNFGHGVPGGSTAVAGIPFENTGDAVPNPSGPMAGAAGYAILSDAGTADDGLGYPGIDNLFFSEVQGTTFCTLDVTGLDPEKRYAVQLLFGEPRDIIATNWTVESDLGGTFPGTTNALSGNIGGPHVDDLVPCDPGQGPLGNGVAGEDPGADDDRHILTFGIVGRTGFSFRNDGWDGKAPAISGFQIRELSAPASAGAPFYPPSPELYTLERIGGANWLGDQFVFTADSGIIFTSPECLDLTQRPTTTTAILNDAAKLGDRIIVNGHVGTILTSDDNGESWQEQVSGTDVTLWSIISDGAQAWVFGFDGTVITSTDGETWTPVPTGSVADLGPAAYNGSLFVTGGDDGLWLTSPDGTNWTEQVPFTTAQWNEILWDGSRWLAGFRDGTLATSADGINWTFEPFVARTALTSLVWTGERYVAGDRFGSFYVSPDATTWTEVFGVPNDGIRDIEWTGCRLVATSQNGLIQWSPDGLLWTAVSCPVVSIGDTVALEHHKKAIFPLSLSHPVPIDTLVYYETRDGTAMEHLDYEGESGTAVIPAGETSGYLKVRVKNDYKPELDEEFFVDVTGAKNAKVGNDTGTALIPQNDFWCYRRMHSTADGGEGPPIEVIAAPDVDNWTDWMMEQNLEELSDGDLNGDGYPDLLHYALGIAAEVSIPSSFPDLLPHVDTALNPGIPTVVLKIPDELPTDIILEVEESFDGANWQSIAARDAESSWLYALPNLVTESEAVGGYRTVQIMASSSFVELPTAFYRVRVTLAR